MIYIKETELTHHGVKGMKWGVRHEERKEARRKKKQEKIQKKKAEKFRRNYNQNWYKSYNKATAHFNSRIGAINDKYEGVTFDDEFSTKIGQKYVKEVNDMWQTAYTKALKEDFGNDIPKQYIENAPFMNNYASFIKK